MNPYERRIIHSAVQQVEGATSSSIGEEPNRRVVISSKNPRPARYGNRDRGSRGARSRGGYNKRPYTEGRGSRRDNRPPRDTSASGETGKIRSTPPTEAEGAPLFGKINLDD